MNSPAYQAALRFLRRDLTAFEVRLKLSRQGFDPDEIEAATDRLCELGYVDDRRIAERELNLFLTSNKGRRYLENRLRQRGVDSSIIAGFLSNLDPEATLERARRAASKIHSDNQARVARRLASAGFEPDIIRSVIEEIHDLQDSSA